GALDADERLLQPVGVVGLRGRALPARAQHAARLRVALVAVDLADLAAGDVRLDAALPEAVLAVREDGRDVLRVPRPRGWPERVREAVGEQLRFRRVPHRERPDRGARQLDEVPTIDSHA